MAVGGTSNPNDTGGFLAERWNGTRWSTVPTPPAGEPGAPLTIRAAAGERSVAGRLGAKSSVWMLMRHYRTRGAESGQSPVRPLKDNV